MQTPGIKDSTLDLAESITLADLLENVHTHDDTVSMLANVSKYLAHINADLGPDDEELAFDLHRVSMTISNEEKNQAFQRLRDRRVKLYGHQFKS